MIIYFRGCVVREKLKYISDATEKILKQADIEFTILKNETCCGSVFYEQDLGKMHRKS